MPGLSDRTRIQSRIDTLRDLHRRYDHAADEESRRRLPDEGRLKRLKLARLAVKDEMGALERRLSDAPSPGSAPTTLAPLMP